MAFKNELWGFTSSPENGEWSLKKFANGKWYNILPLRKPEDQPIPYSGIQTGGNEIVLYSSSVFAFNDHLWVATYNGAMWNTADGLTWNNAGCRSHCSMNVSVGLFRNELLMLKYNGDTGMLFRPTDEQTWEYADILLNRPIVARLQKWTLCATSKKVYIFFQAHSNVDEAFTIYYYKSEDGSNWVGRQPLGQPAFAVETEPFLFNDSVYLLTRKSSEEPMEVWRLIE